MGVQEVLGAQVANTMMEHLPPVGWADVATKRDLDVLHAGLDAQSVAMKRDLDVLRAGVDSQITLVRKDLESLEHRMVAMFGAGAPPDPDHRHGADDRGFSRDHRHRGRSLTLRKTGRA